MTPQANPANSVHPGTEAADDTLASPRFDHTIERNVLGVLLSEPSSQPGILAKLQSKHFDHVPHRDIYAAIQALHESGQPIDNLTVRFHLMDAGLIGDRAEHSIDSLSFEQLTTNASYPEHAEAHADALIRLWADRRIQDYATRLAAAAQAGRRDLWPTILREMEAVQQEVAAAGRKEGELRFLSDEECEDMPPARGIVSNILFEDSIAFLYAREGRWKTFLALDWCLCCATGRGWLGRDVGAGDVVYIAAEGARGIGKRIRAWKVHHEIANTARIHVLPMPVQLLDSGQVRELIAAIRTQIGKPLLVVIDTLARSMAGGDENSTKDINAVTDAAYAIKAAFACCVLVLHHSGKEEARGMRGSSALRGNADTVLRITSGNESEAVIKPGEPITLRCEKSKDGETFDDITLTTQIQTWATGAGQILSSLVMIAGTPADHAGTAPVGSQLKALDTLYRANGGLRATPWHTATCLANGTFYDARDFLTRLGYVAIEESTKTYHVTAAGERHVTPALRNHSDRSTTGVTSLTVATPADVATCSEFDGENPEFMGTPSTPVTPLSIGLAEYRSTLANGHNEHNGHLGGQVELAERVRQLNAQGIHGNDAIRRAIAERGQLPVRKEPVWPA